MKRWKKQGLPLAVAAMLLFAMLPTTLVAAGPGLETCIYVQEPPEPEHTPGGDGSGYGELPEGVPSGGDGLPIPVPAIDAETETVALPGGEGAAYTDGEDSPGLGLTWPETDVPGGGVGSLHDEQAALDTAFPLLPGAAAPLSGVSGADLRVGTWNGDGTNPGDGHRWVEFGGIWWRVLDVYESDGTLDDNNGSMTALLLADEPYGPTRPFHSSIDIDWNGSDIRAWLNNDTDGFLHELGLGQPEKDAIVTSRHTSGGTYTGSSQVFLLSVEEAEDSRYFANNADRQRYGIWWLRSPGNYGCAAIVSGNGVVSPYGFMVVLSLRIRPALRLNLASTIFAPALCGISVTVQDGNGRAINGAAVTLTEDAFASAQVFSNTYGRATFVERVELGGEHTLMVEKFGYKPLTVAITPGTSGPHCTVTLEEDGTLPPYVQFGEHSGTPLEWQVLEIDATPGQPRALLLAENGLHSGSWEDVDAWLNDQTTGFLQPGGYFSPAERAAMLENPDTRSDVFLLSKGEAETYFPQQDMRLLGEEHWWLRSTESDSADRHHIITIGDGAIGHYANSVTAAARPALWADLAALYQLVNATGVVRLTPYASYEATVAVTDGTDGIGGVAITATAQSIQNLPGETLRTWDGVDAKAGTYTGQTDGSGGASFTLLPGSYQIEATAPNGYSFSRWEATGASPASSAANPASFTISGDATITARFEKITHTVTVNSPTVGGSAMADKAQAAEGEMVTLTPAPASGYRFVTWNTTPVSLAASITGNGTTYILTMPGEAVTIEPVFERITYAVTYSLNGGTGTAPTENGKAGGVTFTAADAGGITPPAGKQFKHWSTEQGGGGTAYAPGDTVTMPGHALTLYAIWEDKPGSGDGSSSSNPEVGGSSSSSSKPDTTTPATLAFEALPENNTVRVGDRFTLTPTEDGQKGSTGWAWDSDFFSATFNSPATFTALKAGSSTITYTAPDGRTASVTITIQVASGTSGSTAITQTGDNSLAWAYAAMALLAAATVGGLAILKKRRAKQ